MTIAPWLLITAGLPFSGKTTLARAVAARCVMARVSVDDQISEHAHPDAGQTSDRAWRDAYLLSLQKAEEYLANGRSVIFDSVGHTCKNRYRLRRIADRHNASMVVIHLDIARAIALDRLIANQAAPTRPNVPLDGFNEIADDFEPPGESEIVLTYAPHVPIQTWIDEVLTPYLNGA
jgi:predicted kinase